MRRADRLFQIIQLLRRQRLTTARDLARELEVSERTIYRDVRELSGSGVPIEGEAGVGYRLRDYDLPPLMFSRDEVEALVLGARIVESWTDEELARSASSALAKLEDALPARLSDSVASTALYAPREHYTVPIEFDLALLRHAIRDSRKVLFAYSDARGAATRRTVWPLGLAFFGQVWILAAWCELRQALRAFRPDRMRDFVAMDETFPAQPGRTMEDFVACIPPPPATA